MSTSHVKGQDRRDYKVRWLGPEADELAGEVWKRLTGGASLHDLGLGEHEGRIDLRGVAVPNVSGEKLPSFSNWGLHRLTGYLEFRNKQLEDIDFSGARLVHLRFFHGRITNCKFDAADCTDWKVRATDVRRSSFVGANLRDSAMGIWYEGRANRYEFVNFSRSDMLGLLSSTATYVDCNFSYARLNKIDFQSSSFIRCEFAGEVREVLFHDRAYKSPKEETNPMEDVDFTRAELRWVEFRRLNLDRVLLPDNAEHLQVKHYRCVLQKALAQVQGDESVSGRRLAAVFRHRLKWIGPHQELGIFNRLDFRDAGGREEEDFLLRLLGEAERECSQPR